MSEPTVELQLPLSFVNYALECAADRPFRESAAFITEVTRQTHGQPFVVANSAGSAKVVAKKTK